MSSKKSTRNIAVQKAAKEKARKMRLYNDRIKKMNLRGYLSSSELSYITRAWNAYEDLTKRPNTVFRTKDKSKLKTAQKLSSHERGVKFNVAFVPNATPDAKISVQGDRLIVKSKYVEDINIDFDMKKLANNPAKEIQRVIDKYPEYQSFVLKAGQALFNGAIARSLATERFAKLMSRYDYGGDKIKKDGSNHYTKWAFGLHAYKSQNQRSIDDYVNTYKDVNKKRLKERKLAKKRERQNARNKAARKK